MSKLQRRLGGQRIRLLIAALAGFALCSAAPLRAQIAPSTSRQAQSGGDSFQEIASRAEDAMQANNSEEAMRLFEQAVDLRPTWSEGWWYLGTMNFDAGHLRQAHDAFLHFVTVEHRQPGPGYGMLGLASFDLKRYSESLHALEQGLALGLGDNKAFIHRVLYEDGVLNNYFGRPEVALLRLTLMANQIAAEHPDAPEDAVLANTDLLDAFGLAALRIRELPAEIPAGQAAMIRAAGHAQAFVAMQSRVEAGAEMKQLIAQYPKVPGVHYMYGVFLLKEDPPSAVAQFQRVIALDSRNAVARIQLAFEFLRVSRFTEGLQYAQEAVALAPENFAAHVACGELWLGKGNTNRALHELQTAVRLSPRSPDAHFQFSRALAAAGRMREAAKERREFERLRTLPDEASQ